MDTFEKRVWGEMTPKNKAILQIVLVFTFTLSKTFIRGHVNVCDKYLH
jgi:hypothetical protein